MNALNATGGPSPMAAATVPAGCRGAACPFFVQCQGRCTTRQSSQRIHPDGGVWIETRG